MGFSCTLAQGIKRRITRPRGTLRMPIQLPLNPENWSSQQLATYLLTAEYGRFAPLSAQLQNCTGRDVINMPTRRWGLLEPQPLAMGLRFTLIGMAQIAKSEQSTNGGIMTDFVSLEAESSPISSNPNCTDVKKTKKKILSSLLKSHSVTTPAVPFPPMIEFPSVLVLTGITIIVIVAILCFTVLKKSLEGANISSQELLKYGSIPLVSIVFTYIHIWIALWMTFYPVEFTGCLRIPGTNVGLGWQGIVPFKAEKMARLSVEIMTKQLIQVQEIFSRIDPSKVVEELEPALFNTIQTVVESMALKYNPELWALLPSKVKEEIIEKVKEEAPVHIEALMDEIRNNIEDVFDIEDMVVSKMCKDKQLMINIFITCGYNELAFIRNSGVYMGGIFGLLQMGLWFFYSDRIVVFPVIGLVVGTITNWLALKMIFEPIEPKKVCCFTLHGLFLRRQHEVAEVYGRLVASEVLNSRNMMDAILKGPQSDRLFELVYDNVQEAVNAATAKADKLINLGLGKSMYANIKSDITNHIVNVFPDSLRQIEDYATEAMDLEVTLRDKMRELTSAEFENLLHPVFEEDEWKLVLMGGILGLAIGFFQAFTINH